MQTTTNISQVTLTHIERVVVFMKVNEVRLVDQPMVCGLSTEQFVVTLQPAGVIISIGMMISSAVEN